MQISTQVSVSEKVLRLKNVYSLKNCSEVLKPYIFYKIAFIALYKNANPLEFRSR